MPMRFGILVVVVGLVSGCATPEKEPQGPPASEYSSMPWNTPRPGEGQGMLGGIFDQQR